jgi:ribosome maturation factor RimP
MDFEQLLETTIGGLGYEMAGWERAGRNGLLRVFIDKPEGIHVDDCAYVSQHLSRVLQVEGVDYGRLEISSPGLDRVLRKERDFLRFLGGRARVKLRVAVNGQRNFVGTLRAAREGKLEMEVDGQLMVFDLANLDKARLVPNI